jgi:hypothetical protein
MKVAIRLPGHRTRQGRSGYDPLDTDFENARTQGLMARKLITGKFRTYNPIYLLILSFVGLIYSVPFLCVIGLFYGNWLSVLPLILSSPYWIVGIAIWVNVFMSFSSEKSQENDENGYSFF